MMLRISAAALLAAGLGACAVEGGGYDRSNVGVGVGVGYGGDYYEPGGYEYGNWGPGYRVGPPCCGHDRGHDQGRPAPSIPSHPRAGGGGHGNSGHTGGGGHGGADQGGGHH
jgi:hypothetical protein